jgi:hypothetical protein
MHHLSDLTTSMNTSTGIINSFNMSPSQSSAFYTSSLYMPHIGILGPSSPTVIMSVAGSGLENAKKSLQEPTTGVTGVTGVTHIMSGIDCGRMIDPNIDSTNALHMMDISAYPKSDCPSSLLSWSLLTAQSSESQQTSTTSSTVLPPVSTFLLPSFRDHGWWSDRLDRLKSNTKDSSDCDCYGGEEREYNRSASPSTLTTLQTSLSN